MVACTVNANKGQGNVTADAIVTFVPVNMDMVVHLKLNGTMAGHLI
jgi:hypothetical protein